jgi:NADPH:quinone reductase
MRQAIRYQKSGGPEVLTGEEVELGKPGANEARIRHIVV